MFASSSRAFATHLRAARHTSAVSPCTPYCARIPIPCARHQITGTTESHSFLVYRTLLEYIGSALTGLVPCWRSWRRVWTFSVYQRDAFISVYHDRSVARGIHGRNLRDGVNCFSSKSFSREPSNWVTSCSLAIQGSSVAFLTIRLFIWLGLIACIPAPCSWRRAIVSTGPKDRNGRAGGKIWLTVPILQE